jgi:hypothetical protein
MLALVLIQQCHMEGPEPDTDTFFHIHHLAAAPPDHARQVRLRLGRR